MIEFILARYNYWIVIALMMTGLYIVFSRGNLVKTLIGLNLFQTSVFIFYITVSKVFGGTAPILIGSYEAEEHAHGGDHHGGGETHGEPQSNDLLRQSSEEAASELAKAETPAGDAAAYGAEILYSNPLPHVLILTAIVVGVATTAVGLSLAVRIREAYGTVEEDHLEVIDNQDDRDEALA